MNLGASWRLTRWCSNLPSRGLDSSLRVSSWHWRGLLLTVLHICPAEGKLYMWGAGSYGQLGSGTLADSHIPQAVQFSGIVTTFATGGMHSAAIVGMPLCSTSGRFLDGDGNCQEYCRLRGLQMILSACAGCHMFC